MKFLTCDPGIKGAFALCGDGALTIRDMPTYTKKAGARNSDRRFISMGGVLEVVRDAHFLGCDTLLIEDVGGLPGQSAAGAFVFGHGVGWVEMAALAQGMAVERVKAAIWKMRLRVPADKRAARAKASEIMPQHAHWWPNKGHDGRAEAALLGLYAEQYL